MTSRQRTAETVRALLEPVVRAQGCDLEDVTVSMTGRRSLVRVLIDADDGVTLDDVAHASQAVSAALDNADAADPDLFADSYTLEVSSPGVSRPLTQVRHFRRNLGRLVQVQLRSGDSVTGRIASVDEAGVALVVDGGREVVLPHADVVRGQVQIEFRRAEPAPVGTDEPAAPGADEPPARGADAPGYTGPARRRASGSDRPPPRRRVVAGDAADDEREEGA